MSNLEHLTDLFYNKDFDMGVVYDYIEALIYDECYDKQYLYDHLVNTYNKDKIRMSERLLHVVDKISPSRFLVYVLISKGTIVYIGSSTNIESRLNAHRLSKDFDNVLFQQVYRNSDMLKLEMMLIDKYRPELNALLNLKLAKACKIKERLVDYYPDAKVSWETFYVAYVRNWKWAAEGKYLVC